MADRALWLNPKTNTFQEIETQDISLGQFSSTAYFKCINPNCKVRMSLRNSAQGGFNFSSYRNQASFHIDANSCIRNSLVFTASDYSEQRFNRERFFDNLINGTSNSPAGRANKSSSVDNVIQTNPRRAIRGLSSFYRMVISKNRADMYNNYRIGDMFCDTENYQEFIDNPNGYRVLECSYYYDFYKEKAFCLNFPMDSRMSGGKHVRIDIEDRNYFFEIRKLLKDSRHIEPLIIAGLWEKCDDSSIYIATCKIKSRRQIAYIKA